MKRFVLDACALIAYIRKEEGSTVIEKILADPLASLVMHGVNFFEVYYDYKKHQPYSAFLLYDLLKQMNIQLFDKLDKKIIEEAAVFKIHYKMSLADSIACGFAKKLGAPLLTSDHHEFNELMKDKVLDICFIR